MHEDKGWHPQLALESGGWTGVPYVQVQAHICDIVKACTVKAIVLRN